MTTPISIVTQPAGLEPSVADEGEKLLSQWQLVRRRFFRHRLAVIGLVVLIVLMVACFGASWLAPYGKNEQDLLRPTAGPNADHLFGVDELGRDYFSEVLFAGQISLKVALTVALLSSIIGTTLGAIAGYFGRWADNVLMRLTDLFLVVPSIAILAVAIKRFGNNDRTISLVLAAVLWMTIARVVRGQVLSIREKEYIDAARVGGASSRRIIVRHILPNMVGPILVNASLAIVFAIVAESTLSFLGFGVQPPNSSWGLLLSQAAGTVGTNKGYLIIFPGLMLLLVVLCVNFIGDGLRDAFDPQAKH